MRRRAGGDERAREELKVGDKEVGRLVGWVVTTGRADTSSVDLAGRGQVQGRDVKGCDEGGPRVHRRGVGVGVGVEY